jgi:transcriptional regulator with XRE-family HTH domain
MAGQERRGDRARQRAIVLLQETGREIRRARLDLDLSQATAAAAIGRSSSAWSRLERAQAANLPLVDLALAAAVVGLELNLRAYPVGRPLRDRAHLELLERLRASLGPGIAWQTEVPLPTAGDLRAWDALIRVKGTRVGVEAETRARDAQSLQRRLMLKRRDGGVDHLILLLANTRHNRGFLRSAGAGFRAELPLPGPVALERLAAGEDPGGSSILLL